MLALLFGYFLIKPHKSLHIILTLRAVKMFGAVFHNAESMMAARSQKCRVGHRILFRSVRSVLFRSLKEMFRSFPFFFRVFSDL